MSWREQRRKKKRREAAPIEAWRAWRIAGQLPIDTAEGLRRLAEAWDRGENPFRAIMGPFLQAADCTSAHEAPGQHCECGYWAVKTREQADAVRAAYSVPVYGRVQLWGRVIEHTEGDRAQHARILELFTHTEDEARALSERYGVPATAVGPPGDQRGLARVVKSSAAAYYLAHQQAHPQRLRSQPR
jgi:hypothetical protein